MKLEVAKTVHFVIESTFGCDCTAHASGGYATFFNNEKEAKEYLASLADDRGLERGENDGDKMADRRWDEDDTIAWNNCDGRCWKAEYFCKKV